MATYMTIGQIKNLDLNKKTFTLDPIPAYRVESEEGKSEYVVCRADGGTYSPILRKIDQTFKFADDLACTMVVLKHEHARIKVSMEIEPPKTIEDAVSVSIEVL